MGTLANILKCWINLFSIGRVVNSARTRHILYSISGRKHSIVVEHKARALKATAVRPLISPKLPPKGSAMHTFFAERMRKKWNRADKNNFVFVHWGYSWVRRQGFDPAEDGYRNLYMENDLIGFGATQGKDIVGYLCDTQAPYYEGRRSTDLEDMLNAYPSGAWQRDPATRAFIEAFVSSNQHKYDRYSAVSDLDIGPDDVLVMGQVGTDASWYSTDCAVSDNVDLVNSAVRDFPEARVVYFKAHPRWAHIAEDCARITRMHPKVVHIDPAINFKTLIRMRPKVVVNTSGTGLDAGLLGCEVHAYGYSFYAGWGATIDHHPSKSNRRTNRLTFEDIFVVTTLNYSTHFHRDTFADATVEEITAEITPGK